MRAAVWRRTPLLGTILRQQWLFRRGFRQEVGRTECNSLRGWTRSHSSAAAPQQPDKPAPPIRHKKVAKLPTDTNSTNPLFADLDSVYEQIKKNLNESLRIERMTDIQAKTYDAQLQRRDVIGIAPDRAGKTLAFLLPFIHERMKYAGTKESGAILKRNDDIHMILLTSAPVYARALHQEITNIFAHMGPFLTVQQCHEDQHPSLETARLAKKYPTVLISTPTRFLHHMEHSFMRRRRKRNVRGFKRKKTTFASIIGPKATALVLDEADRLVSHYSNEITEILDSLPPHPERHTVAFATSYPTGIRDIPGLLQTDTLVTVDCSQQHQRIEFVQSRGLKKRMRLRARMEQRDLTEPLPEQPMVSLHALLGPHALPMYAVERALASKHHARRRQWLQLLEQWFVADEETEHMAPLYELWRRMRSDEEATTLSAHMLRLLTLLVMRKVKVEGYLSEIEWKEDVQQFLDSAESSSDESAPREWEKWMQEVETVEQEMEKRQRVSRTNLLSKRKFGLLTPSQQSAVSAGTSNVDDAESSSDKESERTDSDDSGEEKGSS